MSIGSIDTQVRAQGFGFAPNGRLAPIGVAHPTYCNREFCASVATIAERQGLSAAGAVSECLDALRSGDHSAWRARCSAAGGLE